VLPVDLIADAAENVPHRPSWDEYFMATAVLISSRSNCERLHVGCVIVTAGERRNRIVAAGYNGFLPGTPHVSRVREGHVRHPLSLHQLCENSRGRGDRRGQVSV
jgi:dCMP deaminase